MGIIRALGRIAGVGYKQIGQVPLSRREALELGGMAATTQLPSRSVQVVADAMQHPAQTALHQLQQVSPLTSSGMDALETQLNQDMTRRDFLRKGLTRFISRNPEALVKPVTQYTHDAQRLYNLMQTGTPTGTWYG